MAKIPLFRLLGLWSLLLALLAAGCGRTPPLELHKTTIDRDTTWQGTVVLHGDVLVAPGVTLTVAPGTVVKLHRIDEQSPENMFGTDSPYYPYAEIIVRGRLIARGTPEEPIVFTSAEPDARPRDWGALNFLGSDGSVLEHVKVLCAYNGVHAHGSTLTIRSCEFVKNGVGISFKSEEETPGVPWFGKRSRLEISGCVIARNKGGIGFRNSSGIIERNEIRDNKFFGVFAKERSDVVVRFNEITGNRKGVYLYQVQGMRLEYNNIYDNRDYNIAPAEAQDFPVAAPHNWFGTRDRQAIAETIFDRAEDADLAEVMIDPVAEAPVEWERER